MKYTQTDIKDRDHVTMTFRLTLEEAREFDEFAARHCLKKTAYMRNLVLSEIRADKKAEDAI
ncbi:hypothetical protein [Treponema socranskii]|uniref:hypothetical protein n=1 Tax=Treponema socranskii TaxID=53419 RepID=UPI0028EDF04A|nr:hypothetical protein [Treponema socranskii]